MEPTLIYTTEGSGFKYCATLSLKNTTAPKVSFCGDSAWWFISDGADPGEWAPRPDPLHSFSDIMVSEHGLGTTEGKVFPSDLALSGLPRWWTMVRNEGQETEQVLCAVRGFVEKGSVQFHPPESTGD
jgi:hypothetical protein